MRRCAVKRTAEGSPPQDPVNPGLVHVSVVELAFPLTDAVPVHVPPVAPGVLMVKLPLNALPLTAPVIVPLNANAGDAQVPPIVVPDCVRRSDTDCWGKFAESIVPAQVPDICTG